MTFTIESRDLASYRDLERVYGVFSTRQQAKSRLEQILKTYQLCPKLLGLEKASGACFRYQLGLCRGACIGKESPESYNQRVEYALERTRIDTWPYETEVVVQISPTRQLLIDQWVPTHIYDQESDTNQPLDNKFDIDTYKIIRSFIRAHPESVRLLG